jgi:FtsP/CotA-like multicopper oxidase with cupredoxin domain
MRNHLGPRNQIVRLGLATMVAMATFVTSAKSCKAQSAAEQPRRFELTIENGRLTNAAKTLQVRRGEAVELIWTADRRSVLHLHGYDIEVTVGADKPQTMSFRARATGRFPIEIHGGRHTVLVYLEVHPR